MTKQDRCDLCTKFGLPILPVLALPAPKDTPLDIPAAISLPRVKAVPLTQSKYVLRTLRQGYVYLFYEKKWTSRRKSVVSDWYTDLMHAYEVYSVAKDGTLWKEPSVYAATAADEPRCSRLTSVVPTTLISIADPENAGKVWLAFSEHRWSLHTLDRYANDAGLREKRMQGIDPVAWQSGGARPDAVEATNDTIRSVLEYSLGPAAEKIMPNKNALLSDETGKCAADILRRVSTRYPVYSRIQQLDVNAAGANTFSIIPAMREIGGMAKKGVPASKPYRPMLLVLHDAIGMVHELNGFRADAGGAVEKFGFERELQLVAADGIAAAKAALETRANNDADGQLQAQIFKVHQNMDAERMRVYTDSTYNPYSLASVADRQARLDKLEQDEIAACHQRAQHYQAQAGTDATQDWKKYEPLITAAYTTFDANQRKLLADVSRLMNERTPDVISWLCADLLIDTLEDFHPENPGDGVAFEQVIEEAVVGINSSEPGATLLEKWADAKNPHDPKNLLWRTVAMNQKEGRDALKELLEHATRKSVVVGMTFEFLTGPLRKMSDLYKKTNSMVNTEEKARDAKNGIALKRVYGGDKAFLTWGDRLFKPFLQKGIDTVGEKVVSGVLMVRAEVEPERVIKLLDAEAKYANDSRLRTAKLYKLNPNLRSVLVDAKHKNLKEAWTEVAEDAKKGPKAFKENRLALVVVLLEAINMGKTVAAIDSNDMKTVAIFVQASCSTTAATLDLVANTAKHLGGEASMTFQALKVTGGLFSAVSGAIGAFIDFFDAADKWKDGAAGIASLVFAKGLSQSAATVSGGLTALTYAAPWLEKSSSAALTEWSAPLLRARLGFMLWGVRFNMITLALTGAIFLFKEDKLRSFLEQNRLGVKGKEKALTASQQRALVQDALCSIV